MYKIIFKFLIITFFLTCQSIGDVVRKIEIYGNDRITDQTIQIFNPVSINDDIDAEELNIILKKLYETNYFEDVKVSFKENIQLPKQRLEVTMANGYFHDSLAHNLIALCSANITVENFDQIDKITLSIEVDITKEDIERMVKEADEFAKDDQELREKIEAKNQLEALTYQTRSSLNKEEIKSKLEESDIETVTNTLTEVDEWLLNEDHSKSDYENKLNELNGILQPIMMKAMSQGSEGFPSQESVPPSESGAGPTIDEVD